MKKVVYLVIVDGEIDSAHMDKASAEARRDEMFADDMNDASESNDLDPDDEQRDEKAAYIAGYDGGVAYIARIPFETSKLDRTYTTDEGDELDGYQIDAALKDSGLENENDEEDSDYDDYD